MDADWTEKQIWVLCAWEGTDENENSSGDYGVVFRDEEGKRMQFQVQEEMAYSIYRALQKEVPERPYTHDLMMTVLNQAGLSIQRATICDLRDDTFYATITLVQGENVCELDARPSDAVALALRADAPIYVTRQVWDSIRSSGPQET